jgi:hypothetical protein
MLLVSQGRHRKEPLIPKQTDDMIEVFSVVGDMTDIVTIDPEKFVEVSTTTSSVSSPSPESPRPRKRARLDHMTAEEKAQHRKMMNRISAQSARDRQKLQMQQQEIKIQELSEENEKLKKDNKHFRELIAKYESKIALLELKAVDRTAVKEEPATEKSLDSSFTEPAVPRTIPLPKGSQLLTNLSLILVLWNFIQSLTSNPQMSFKLSMNSPNTFSDLTKSLEPWKKLSTSQQQTLLLQLKAVLKNIKLEEPG